MDATTASSLVRRELKSKDAVAAETDVRRSFAAIDSRSACELDRTELHRCKADVEHSQVQVESVQIGFPTKLKRFRCSFFACSVKVHHLPAHSLECCLVSWLTVRFDQYMRFAVLRV